MYTLYSVGLSIAFGLQLPRVLLQASAHGKYRAGIGERLGHYHLGDLGARPLWLHAVSVGEVMATAPWPGPCGRNGRGAPCWCPR